MFLQDQEHSEGDKNIPKTPPSKKIYKYPMYPEWVPGSQKVPYACRDKSSVPFFEKNLIQPLFSGLLTKCQAIFFAPVYFKSIIDHN